MLQPVLDTLLEQSSHFAARFRRQRAANHIAAQGKRELKLLVPPFPQVQHLGQAFFGIGQLAFVNHDACIGFAVHDAVNDLVEGNEQRLDLRFVKLKRQETGGQLARDRDSLSTQGVSRHGTAGHHNGSVAITETCARG